jgi:hypothetical protein
MLFRFSSHYLRALPALLLCAKCLYAQNVQPVTIETSGTSKLLYSWTAQRCGENYIPDAPARAFRRADGQVSLLATNSENWALLGRDLLSAKPVCNVSLSSAKLKAQEIGDMWIEAAYTEDGKNIFALLSQDLTPVMKTRGCQLDGTPNKCWVNNIIEATSSDMGASYVLLPPNRRTVASLGTNYSASTIGRFGAFTTSNVVGAGGFFYFITWAEGTGIQRPGNCLLRSATPFDAESWRAWDGTQFITDMHSPTSPVPCLPVDSTALPNEVRSLSFDIPHKVWIAVFASRQKLIGDMLPIPGFYYTTSPDLIHWDKNNRRIMPAPTVAREQQLEYMVAYPSLLDPSSKSQNFETIDGDTAIITFTVKHLSHGSGTMNRDLQYVLLHVH